MSTKQQIPDQTQKGVICAVGAFTIWGLNPIYFRMIRQVSATEIIAHRVIWMIILLLLAVTFTRKWGVLKGYLTNRRLMGMMVITALLISTNWLAFTWAVTHDRVLHTSMGYFINPICNVFLGMVFLRERLRPGQTVSVVLAGIGVGYMIIQHGSLPWIAIILPITFGTYGLLRKQIQIDSFNGLLIEAIILTPIALGYLVYLSTQSAVVFLEEGTGLKLLIMLSGPITIAPLMLFAAGVKRIPLSTIGVFQYIGPSLTFLLGVFVFKEPFDSVQLVTFTFIWVSLIIFTFEGLRHSRRESQGDPELSYNTK
ncbi:MAG: EamA family transporter RarD [Candidatus Hydrogenedentota bacterium]